MMSQDHVVLAAERLHKPFALTQIRRDALEIVIRDLLIKHRAVEAVRGKPLFRAGNGNTGCRMRVGDEMGVIPRGMNGGMDREARRVDAPRSVHNLAPLKVDLD